MNELMTQGTRIAKLGEILLRQKLMSEAELEHLLTMQQRFPGTRLASVASREGVITDLQLLRALSEQHGVPGIDLSQVVIPLSNLNLLPAEVSKQHYILPILVKDESIYMAMADPSDRRVITEIEFASGKRVLPYVALHDALAKVIVHCYQIAEQGQDYYIGAFVPQDYLRSVGLLDKNQAGSEAPSAEDAVSVEELAPVKRDVAVRVTAQEHRQSTQDKTPQVLPPTFQLSGAPQNQSQSKTEAKTQGETGSNHAPFRPSYLDPSTLLSADHSGLLPSLLAHPGGRRHVLVVDDEHDIRRLLTRVLQERNFEVIEASSGLETLQALRSYSVDVILLDAMLPDIHGFEICRRLRGTRRYGHIPVILVSAVYRGQDMAQELKERYGLAEFLEKPFRIDDVLQTVERVLKDGDRKQGEDLAVLEQASEQALLSGVEAYKGNRIAEAIEHLKRGIDIDPLGFRLHYHLGLLYGQQGKFVEAVHELEIAVDLQSKNYYALKNLAVLYQKVGFLQKAIKVWERALGVAPDDGVRQGIRQHLVSLV